MKADVTRGAGGGGGVGGLGGGAFGACGVSAAAGGAGAVEGGEEDRAGSCRMGQSVSAPSAAGAAQVAPVLQQVAEAHGCSLVEGVLSHQLKQYVIDGNKCILNKVAPESPNLPYSVAWRLKSGVASSSRDTLCYRQPSCVLSWLPICTSGLAGKLMDAPAAQVTPDMRVDDQEFEENEVYALDIVVRPIGSRCLLCR